MSTDLLAQFSNLRPFTTLRFARLLVETLRLKARYRETDRDYRQYLRHYYRRENNPHWEQVKEDKWQPARPVVLRLAGLQPGERVLDIATGAGFQAAACSGGGRVVVGLDYIHDRLQVAAERHMDPSLSWVTGDAVRLPFRSKSFAVVTISLALHDMPQADMLAALAEAHRIARRRVVVLEPRLPRQKFLRPVYRLLATLFDESLWIGSFLEDDIVRRFSQAGLCLSAYETCCWGTLAVYASDI